MRARTGQPAFTLCSMAGRQSGAVTSAPATTRARAAAAAVVLALGAAPVPAAASLAEVQAHLAATRTMTASFTQVADSGQSLSGRLTLERPGKVRFQYDTAPILVVADGRTLSFIDYKVAQVSSWPIRQTPLAVLLDPTLDLSRHARLLPESRPGMLIVEARDPARPEYGMVTLSFARDAGGPGGLRLDGWQVIDAQGRRTRVVLGDVRFNQPVGRDAFRFRDPRPRAAPGKS
jgi:outer membrane lipoprotein-sorting protein